MVPRLIIQTGIWIAGMAAILFIPAGTVHWPGAWVFLAEMGGGGLAIGLWLAENDPGLLDERLSPMIQQKQEGRDKKLMASIIILWFAWMVIMALDSTRYRLSHVPAWLQGIGALGPLASLYIGYRVFRENSFAAPVVKIQKERGQKVVTSGPYRYVRHPMYAGAILFFLGTPLLLGSWFGLAMTPILIILLAARIVMEEKTLRDGLEGYGEYMTRVRYRLLPGIWLFISR
jgi:protein-S-isoprenylcysteine O-methyltransferase Ste14